MPLPASMSHCHPLTGSFFPLVYFCEGKGEEMGLLLFCLRRRGDPFQMLQKSPDSLSGSFFPIPTSLTFLTWVTQTPLFQLPTVRHSQGGVRVKGIS